MMNIEEKIRAFELFCYSLIEWGSHLYKIPILEFESSNHNDLGIHKIMSLLYFAFGKSPELLDIFDNIHANVYTIKEKDVYENLNKSKNITFKLRYIRVLNETGLTEYLSADQRDLIHQSVRRLRDTNFGLIDYSLYELGDVIKRHYAFGGVSHFFFEGKSYGFKLQPRIIREEIKYYGLPRDMYKSEKEYLKAIK